jgi:hypothetical protein
MASKPNEYRPIVNALHDQGWEVEQTTKGHWKATPPDKTKPVVHFSYSGDYRSVPNCIRDLKRSGLLWPPPPKPKATPTLNAQDVDVLQRMLDEEPSAPPPPTPKEPTMESVFAELKEAKEYFAMADDDLAKAQAQLEEAQRNLAEKTKHRDEAVEVLKKKKAAFDRLFEATAA